MWDTWSVTEATTHRPKKWGVFVLDFILLRLVNMTIWPSMINKMTHIDGFVQERRNSIANALELWYNFCGLLDLYRTEALSKLRHRYLNPDLSGVYHLWLRMAGSVTAIHRWPRDSPCKGSVMGKTSHVTKSSCRPGICAADIAFHWVVEYTFASMCTQQFWQRGKWSTAALDDHKHHLTEHPNNSRKQ